MSGIHKYAVAAMPTMVFLFLVPICHRDLHLPLVMNGAKMTGKAPHVWVQYFFYFWLVYIDHNPCLEFTNMQLLQRPPLFCCSLFLFVT
jgi:hypothetical protein